MKVYFGLGGLQLNIPVIKELTNGCFPTATPSQTSWYADMAGLYEQIALYCKPSSKREAKKSKINFISHLVGLAFFLLYQQTHFLQDDS